MKLLNSKKDRVADAFINGTFDKAMYERKASDIDRQIKELQRLMLEDSQLSKLTFSKDDLLVKRDLDYINRIRFPMLFDPVNRFWNDMNRNNKLKVVLSFIDHIELKQVGKIVAVDRIFFRDSFYNNFHKMFLDGYVDTTILPPFYDHNVKIRYSNFRPREEMFEHLQKLRKYYDVLEFPAMMNFETGKVIHTMEDNYDFVRIYPIEPVDIMMDLKEFIQ